VINRAQILIVVILALVLMTIVYLVLMTRSRSQRIERYRRAYAEIKLGDTRDVIGGMGKPYEVTGCSYTPFADPNEEAEFDPSALNSIGTSCL
jgi:septation ring formation regulator EzrA